MINRNFWPLEAWYRVHTSDLFARTMNRVWQLLSVCLFATSSACCAAASATVPSPGAAPLRVATSVLPPYALDGDPDAPGALLEVVQEILRRTDASGNIEFVPWRRALLLPTTQPRTLIFPLTRLPEREAQYRWLTRLYQEHFVFLTIDGTRFDVQDPARSKDRRIGMLRGSAMTATLRALGYRQIVEASSVDEGMRFLQRGIVDAVCGDRALLQRALKGRGLGKVMTSAPISSTVTWLGGSLDFSNAEAAAFQKAMQEMIEDGAYARILKKYELAHP